MTLSSPERDPDFVRSLARGLKVLSSFSQAHPRLTLTEAAKLADLTRPTARRILLTLEQLGYVRRENRHFEPTPKVLDIGYAFVASFGIADLANEQMEDLVEKAHESCSVSVLDGSQIVYVARVPTKRIMSISLGLGSRLPAYATSMGRVLMADLNAREVDRILAVQPLERLTAHTIVDRDRFIDEINSIRQQGWAVVDQELEEGLRSIAAPLRNRQGKVIAAMNLGTHASRVDLDTLIDELLPLLLRAADHVNERLARR